jgi:hypothetical protein
MILFKFLWFIDAIISVVFLYFFFAGLGDGTVSGSNILLWLLILGGLAVILYGSSRLKAGKHPYLAILLLLIAALPAMLFALYMLIALRNHERWN